MTLKSFKLVIVLSSASICRALVNCGYYNDDDTYTADTCASCLEGPPRRALQRNGARWCDGDCTWDGSTGQCKRLLQPVESVSCGNHIADTCADCPQGNGAAFCNGDCIWDGSTGQCKPQSAECGSIGSNLDSCAKCPLESSCSSTDCSWHPHTSLCRDAFSDEVRTASVYLNYDRPSGVFEPAWWFQRVIPTASADVTVFSTNGHRFGFGGIQQESETLGRVIFGLYDQGGCDQDLDPNCNAENIPETVACGTGVNCAGFAFEGTSPGRVSELDLDLAAGDGDFPQVGQEYYFITQASYLGNRRMEYTGYFYLNGEWRLISRIQVSTNSNEDWSIDGLYSSVKQCANIDTTRDRGALFGPSFMAPVNGSDWQQVPSATFTHGTLENHERVNAWQAEADQDFAVGIATGGDTARNASNYCTFDYPPMTKVYDSLGSFSKKVPCLNDATTQSEIEACLISTSSPSPSQYPTPPPSQYPTISTPPPHLPTEPPTHSPTEPPTHSPTVPTKSLIPSMSSSKSSSQSPTVPKKKPLPISETPPVSSQSLSIATNAIIVSAAIFSLCLGIF